MKLHDEIRARTLASYNEHIGEYLYKKDILDEERTAAYWAGVEHFLSRLSPGTSIYEVGTGSGYDARRIEESGFRVDRSYAAKAFLDELRRQGFAADYYDVLERPLGSKVNAIYANAVLLHFNEKLFRQALRNLKGSINPGGLLCLGMKIGEFEGWRDKGLSGSRYFKFWQQDDLRHAIQLEGFTVINETLSADGTFIVLTAKQ